MRISLTLLPILISLLALTACSPNLLQAQVADTSTPATFDRRAMLANTLNASILPLHKQLVSQTDALQQTVYKFETNPTTENLAEVQQQWQATARAWAQAEHLGLRFTMIIHNQIKKWPINIAFIEEFIAEESDPIDEPFIDSIGSTSKGLAAIEYLVLTRK